MNSNQSEIARIKEQMQKEYEACQLHALCSLDILQLSSRFPQVVLDNLFFIGYPSHRRAVLRAISSYEMASADKGDISGDNTSPKMPGRKMQK